MLNIHQVCKHELQEIENCPDCYLNAHVKVHFNVHVKVHSNAPVKVHFNAHVKVNIHNGQC